MTYIKATNCKYCKITFDKLSTSERANHTRWCDKNPKLQEYRENLSKARNSKINFRNQYYYGARMSNETREKIRQASSSRKHSEEVKEVIRQKALASSHRRLRKGVIEYRGVLLDSSWELALAKRLDELKIEWSRPEPLTWIDENGLLHNYFPDFYLKDYDLYLDPKNPQAIKVQQKKLDLLLTQYKNIVIIKSLDECKKYSP